jgi:hypothetical protein
MENNEFESPVEFQSALEMLRISLERNNFFIYDADFEDIFEASVRQRVNFSGGKVDKALQLVNYLKENESITLLPEGFQKYVEIIRDDIREKSALWEERK